MRLYVFIKTIILGVIGGVKEVKSKETECKYDLVKSFGRCVCKGVNTIFVNSKVRLTIGLICIGTGGALVASCYIRVPND